MMVDFFRRRMKGFIWLIIATFVLSIFFIAAGSIWSGRQNAEKQAAQEAAKKKSEEQQQELDFGDPRQVATVVYKGKSEFLTEGELNRAVVNARQNSQIYRGSTTSAKAFKTLMGEVILDNLVKERLVMMEADSLNMDVGKDVDDILQKNYDKAGGKDKLLASINMNEPALRKYVERQVKQERVVQSVTGGKAVTDKAVEDYYQSHPAEFKSTDGKGVKPLASVRTDIVAKLRTQVNDTEIKTYYEQHKARWKLADKVTVRHLMFDPSAERWKKQVKIAADEVAKYYEEHKSDFKAAKKVHLRHIFLDPASDAFKDAAKVSDEEVRKRFDEKFPVESPVDVSEIRIAFGKTDAERSAARKKADDLRERIEKGESFAALAAKENDDELKAKAGERGTLRPSELPEPLGSTVKELEAGQVSPVVPAEKAFHIFQVTTKHPMPEKDLLRDKLFDVKKLELTKDLEQSKREDAARSKLGEIAKSVHESMDTTASTAFDEAAKKFSEAKSASTGGDLGTLVLGENKKSPLVDEVGANGYLDESITDIVTELKAGEVSRPVKSAKGLHLVQLVEVLPSEFKVLADVKKEIEQRLVDKKAEAAVLDELAKLKKEFAGEGLAKDAKKRSFEDIVKAGSDGADAKDGGLWKDITLSDEDVPALPEAVQREVYSVRGLHRKIVDGLKSLEPGKLSEPVVFGRTQHLFSMEKRDPVAYKPFDEKIATEIKETLNPEVTGSEMRSYFDSHRSDFEEPAKISLQHILVTEEEVAKEVLDLAQKGESFEYLAKKYSRDPTTKDKGGQITSDTVIPEIRKALETAEAGKVFPRPVKTFLGWHILKLVSREGAKPASFETAKSKIREKLMPEKREKVLKAWIEELENQAVVRKHFPVL
ncbi:MAG: peptidyl-prolyl cis-trans isomerase [Candidatus Wallbacteria bacterium]|nr:peptidyl-prolyl cis-trans isomerase [Candidatus Wallbacteria bacterium]